jgi:hypothetical protein
MIGVEQAFWRRQGGGNSLNRIAASAGGFFISGTAASLEFGREVVGGAGSFAVTGAAATLTKTTKTVIAGAGSYVITGTAATLTVDTSEAAGRLGLNLIPLGDMSANTGWTEQGGASIAGGTVTLGTGPVSRVLRSDIPTHSAGYYRISIDLLATSGGGAITVSAGGQALVIDAASPSGTYSADVELDGLTNSCSVNGTDQNDGVELDNFTLKQYFPNAGNTGIQDGVSLTPLSGDQEISSSGVYEDKDITGGSLVVNADNVTVRNCRVTYDGGTAKIYIASGKTGVVIEYCEVDGTVGNQGAKGIWVDEANGVEIRFCNIYNIEDGIYAFGDDTYVHDNYIHSPANINEDPHHDGIQFAGEGVVIEHNTFECGVDQNACIQFAGTPGFPIDLTVNYNMMLADTGVAPLALMNMNDSLTEVTRVRVTNNHMTPGTNSVNPYFLFNVAPPNVWYNNINADTLVEVTPPSVVVAGDEIDEGIIQIGVAASANTGTVSSSITIPADTEMILVFMSGYGRADTANYHTDGTVTFTKGGSDTAMTSVGAADSDTGLWQGSLWYMMEPDTGTSKSLKWDWVGSSSSDDQQKNWVIVCLKGVDLGDPVRASGGAQAGSAPVSTASLAGGTDSRAFVFTAMYNGSGDGAGAIDSWTNCLELAEITHQSTSEVAIATASPSGSTVYTAATSSNVTNVAISAIVVNAAGYL